MSFDLPVYFQRIGLAGCHADADGLGRLMDAQQRAIPFENLDPLLGIVPDLDPAAVWAKLVTDRRGGYCFELNGLFGQALRAAGFSIRPVMARVHMGAPTGGPRSHLAWIVAIGGTDWLADAGFGGPGFRLPLMMATDGVHDQEGERYRIVHGPGGRRTIERETDNGWFALYSFDEAAVQECDIEAANVVCARWAKSPFPNHLMVNVRTRSGRHGLLDLTLTSSEAGKVTTTTIASGGELRAVLADRFRLSVASERIEAIMARIAPPDAAAT